MDTAPSDTQSTALELRRLALDEGRLALERQRLDNERRDTRTPAEVDFDLAIRMATTLADSPVLYYDEGRPQKLGSPDKPDYAAYRQERIAFACQLLSYAQAMDVPLALLAGQAHIVKGRVGFATTYLIALVNARGRLTSPIDWTVQGQGDGLSVTCTAADPAGVVREVTITLAQAKTWGWANSTGPWKADPALMLRYRTAAQLIRLYFSSAVFGLPLVSAEELRDLRPGEIEGESTTVTPARPMPLALPENIVPAVPPPLPVQAPAHTREPGED